MSNAFGFGALFKNNRGNGPEYTGSLDIKASEVTRLIDYLRDAERVERGGEEFVKLDLAAKVKETRNGDKYFSLWVSEQWKPQQSAQPATTAAEDDVPF